MSIAYVLPGSAAFLAGFVLLFVLLASVGALAKSRQLEAFGALASGRAGSSKRTLFFVALALLFFGACGSFAGVGMNDARRARACRDACAARGHGAGVIGPSKEKHPTRPNAAAFVACTCSGGPTEPVELHADDL